MKKSKNIRVGIVIILIIIGIYFISDSKLILKSGKVIDYIELAENAILDDIKITGMSPGSRIKMLHNDDFDNIQMVIDNLIYKRIIEYSKVETFNEEDILYRINLSDEHNKYEIHVIKDGLIISNYFENNGMKYSKLIIDNDSMNNLVKELKITNPL